MRIRSKLAFQAITINTVQVKFILIKAILTVTSLKKKAFITYSSSLKEMSIKILQSFGSQVDLVVQVYWVLFIKMAPLFSIPLHIILNLITILGINKPMFFTWNSQPVLASVQPLTSQKKLPIKFQLNKQFKHWKNFI